MLSHRDELTADFRQYYGLDLADMGRAYSVAHAAILAAQLPEGARSLGVIDPVLSWSVDRYLLASVEYSLRALLWSRTKDAEKGRNKPKMVPTPSQREALRRKVEKTDIERIRKALGIEEA